MNLSLAGQDRLDAATVNASSQPPSDLWQSIAISNRFQGHLIESVRDLLAETRYYDWVLTLRDAGVTAHDGRYAQLIAWLDRPPEHDYHQDTIEYTAELGQGQTQLYGVYPTLDKALGGDLVVVGGVWLHSGDIIDLTVLNEHARSETHIERLQMQISVEVAR
mgnify:CR=1 FL=1